VFTLTVLGPKEAEMRIIGCDFHTRQQTLAMLDSETGELVKMTLPHEGNNVREFYSANYARWLPAYRPASLLA
jgi:hypothetical protein